MINKVDRKKYLVVLEKIKKLNINTICMAGDCPNRYQCFSASTVTFLLLGNICTRNCAYCNVESGIPNEVDYFEIDNILKAIKYLDLKYVVLTQVTRDDLDDGGAGYVALIVDKIKKEFSDIKVEVLISDLKGDLNALQKVLDSGIDVLNHNIEVVEDLFSLLRKEGNYERSLMILKEASMKKIVKSGLMVGLGETIEQIEKTLIDLKNNGVNIVTIGQYLKPSAKQYSVVKYYSDEEFKMIEKMGYEIGFDCVISGKLVRSSYQARKCFSEKMAIN